jgi:hypothetical protein
LLTPKVDDETQRHKLFHTRCTVNQQIFYLIIDSSNCENTIGRETAINLVLNSDKYPKPYTISWIKEVPKVTVIERCKVSFSIGKYRDKIYCDVVDMNACNLLFGKPWHFDLNAWHRRRENIYRLVKNRIN